MIAVDVRLQRASLWDRPFYFWMALLIAAVVIYGFSFTVNANLFHPPTERPAILYVHGALFTGWLVFLIVAVGVGAHTQCEGAQEAGVVWTGVGSGDAICGG
jgi:hypothetical protein